MPDTSLSEAIKEAFVAVDVTEVVLDTIQISHPDIAVPLFLVADLVPWTLTLETAVPTLFSPAPFRIRLPASGSRGLQNLSIEIDNVDQVPSDWIERVIGSRDAVVITYRPFLSSDTSAPQMDPPLVLNLTDVRINTFVVSGRASFMDVINRRFLGERYLRTRFPSLGQ